MSLEEKINVIVADVLNMDEGEISSELSPEKAEYWDSMAHLTLVTVIEEECDVKLSMDDVQSIKSVGDIYTIVQKHVDSK